MKLRFVQVLMVAAILCILAAILFPVFSQAKTWSGPTCSGHLKSLAVGLLQYAGDNDGLLPWRDGWMDASHPRLGAYYRHPRCDVLVRNEIQGIGYSFNSLLDHRKLVTVKHQEQTPMVYDSINLAVNASDPFTSLPTPGRHQGRNWIAFVDGHAKSIKQDAPDEPNTAMQQYREP